MLVLEELEHARARGATIYARAPGLRPVLGRGARDRARSPGINPARAMPMAIDEARLSPDQIGYINAHGTSTPVGDTAETRVIKHALGEEAARRTPISSTKSMTGHMLGAAGATEAAITLLAMTEGVLPPTINLDDPDPTCDLDYIPNVAREADVAYGLSNGFGFGGHNASLVFGRWDDADGRR